MKNGVSRKMFMWVVGLLIMAGVSAGGYLMGKMDNLDEKFNHNFTEVKEDISAMKNDIGWIKDTLE